MKSEGKILIVVHPGFETGMRNVVNMLSEEFKIDLISFENNLWKNKSSLKRSSLLKNYDLVHFFWGYAKIFDFLTYKLRGNIKIINHFIGTDLLNIIKRSFIKRFELRLCSYFSFFNCVSYILEDDLRKLNISSSVLPFVNQEIKKRTFDLKSRNRLIVYMPSKSKFFFNYEYLLKLAEKMPEAEFTWFPYTKDPDERLPVNIKTIEKIERESVFQIFNENNVFIRIPIHDGLPNTVIEALSMGRWVIWTYNMKNVEKISDFDELYKTAKKLIDHTQPNYAGAEYVLSKFSFEHICNLFSEKYKEILGK